MKDATANPLERLDPGLALRPGDFDAQAVLFLWCVRKSFYPLLWIGFSVAVIAFGDIDAVSTEIESLDTPQAMLSGLLSPFGLIVVAFGVRIVGGLLGLAAAYPLTLSTRKHHYTGNRLVSGFHLLWDRLYQARAYRALRQTWAVRERAHNRLDVTSRIYRVCEFILNWANWVLLFVMFVVIAVFATPSAG